MNKRGSEFQKWLFNNVHFPLVMLRFKIQVWVAPHESARHYSYSCHRLARGYKSMDAKRQRKIGVFLNKISESVSQLLPLTKFQYTSSNVDNIAKEQSFKPN